MNEDFVTISIQCQRCLTWSLDDANFCHRCGANLLPQSEALLFAKTRKLIAESKSIIDRLVENESERLRLETLVPIRHTEVECAHCFRWRNRRRMRQTKSGRFLCFDNVECGFAHEEWLMLRMLVEKGCSATDAEKWIEIPLQVFDGLTPRQMIQDDREEEIKTLLSKMESGFAF